MIKLRITLTTLCLLTLLATGCTQQPVTPTVEKPSRQNTMEHADRELALAASSISPQRELHQLKAAKLLIEVNRQEQALNVLEGLSANNLPNEAFIDYTFTYATLALDNDYFFVTRQLLSNPKIEQQWQQLSIEQQQQWLELRGKLFFLLGEDEKSIEAYVTLSALSTSPEQRQAIHEKIWQVLTHLSHDKLETLKQEEKNVDILGWYALAAITRKSQGDIKQQLEQIELWQQTWPNHPATLIPPPALSSIQKAANDVPKRIAMLLPFQGSLSQAGKAIRSGFLATLYEIHGQSGETPKVRFYDTTTMDDITELYQLAVMDGAQMIIGPVQKDNVKQLLALPELPVPTIALNYLEDTTLPLPANLYQFGLSTTDEARQIADRAWIEGQRSALTITPNTSWGDRTLTAFRDHWQAKGGVVIESPPYSSTQTDFAPLLKPVLHLDQSEARKKRLQQVLGKNLSHTPRRRQDIDMVFMAAYPDHARQIKPTLDFLFARDLQIYGTSHLYTGIENPGRNRDLEGIRFSAMPWTLPGSTDEKLQPTSQLPPLYRHIFALGIDAYHLHQWLPQMVLQPNTQLFGNTGTLKLNAQGAIEREQPWAEFRGGKVRSAQQLTEN
jgi:outer membrane PBP1 activator LpoA protein